MNKPPVNTKLIISRNDLSRAITPAGFTLLNELHTERVVTLVKKSHKVFQILLSGPLYCASTVRLSHWVVVLRDEYGVKIETLWLEDDRAPITTRHGVYVLRDTVRCLGEVNQLDSVKNG